VGKRDIAAKHKENERGKLEAVTESTMVEETSGTCEVLLMAGGTEQSNIDII